ncbi:MAG: hypothetical protein LBS12_03540 [Prevotellaceae bacterium]|nr:hypothetical protein [Prevotellaceae bacterium]
MKRILSILFILTATFSLAVFSVVPHHHHEAVMCAAGAHCGHDNDADTYPQSNHADADAARCTSCITGSETVITNAQNSLWYKLSADAYSLRLEALPVALNMALGCYFNRATSYLFVSPPTILPLCRPSDIDGLRAPPFNV